MLIEGSISTDKTNILIEDYARLINSGISSNEILEKSEETMEMRYGTLDSRN